MKEIKLAILGYGNAGRAFGKLLKNKEEEIKEKYKYNIKVVAITTGTRGSLINKDGIDYHKAAEDIIRDGSFDKDLKPYSNFTSMEVVDKVDYDVLVELTPLEIFSGKPAIDHIRGALNRKKHVITANKGPIAWAYKELKDLAEEKESLFFYETTVMDGTPIFNLADETLKLCKVTEIEGILNTTTNFILEEMAKGKKYDEIIKEGKKRGFVEANPAMDVEGWDAAAKVTALINVLMDGNITPDEIDRKGIEDVTYKDIEEAEKNGSVVKLLCRGKNEDGKITGMVKPVEIQKGNLLASINGTSSAVKIKTDLMGTISIVEHDPEIEQTAYGIFSDLLRIIGKLK
jgi:homoserine dehydrogenase